MSHPKPAAQKQYISVPTLVSTFIGVMAAVPMTLAMNAALNVEAAQPATQALSQSDGEDFAKYAHAFTQGYEASAGGSTSMSSTAHSGCSESTPSNHASHHTAPGDTARAYTHAAPASAHSKKSGGHAPMMSERTARMIESYNTYMSTVNNTTTTSTSNVNSNNTVGSHNSSRTDIDVDDSRGVMIGVSNDTEATQNNASESFNEDSYNTETEVTTVSDSFNTDVRNTTDIDTTNQTTITNTENSHNTHNHTNTLNNNSNNTTEAHVDVNSHNDTTITTPVVVEPAPVDVVQAQPEELPVTTGV